jgi:nucleoside-diphosphate-sugar epimerase
VHLAAIPAPGLRPNAATFPSNIPASYNAYSAAVRAGVRKIAWASSETVLGLPFDEPPPYVPVDEE